MMELPLNSAVYIVFINNELGHGRLLVGSMLWFLFLIFEFLFEFGHFVSPKLFKGNIKYCKRTSRSYLAAYEYLLNTVFTVLSTV